MMKQRKDAEVAILDRLMHMLEEGSVSHLSSEDNRFGEFINELYEIIYKQAEQLTR